MYPVRIYIKREYNLDKFAVKKSFELLIELWSLGSNEKKLVISKIIARHCEYISGILFPV